LRVDRNPRRKNAPLGKKPTLEEIAFTLAAQLPVASRKSAFVYDESASGAYQDKETNLHYNYFRDYDPGIGRYGESDPIGLEGGLNTYSYVAGSPLQFTDPEGLDYWVEGAVKGELGWGLHQSICVGKRNGRRYCISFGRREERNCYFNCDGHVCIDKSAPGDVYGDLYRYTDAKTGRQIRNYFNTLVGTRGTWSLLGDTCRNFSQDLFDELGRTWGGQPGRQPAK
jgi:RHS repeat-associated protein